jgi:hypothetical protein
MLILSSDFIRVRAFAGTQPLRGLSGKKDAGQTEREAPEVL